MKNIEKSISKMKENASLLGNKAAADIFFTELGVGVDAVVFPPDTKLTVIKNILDKKVDFEKGVVVRFSKDNEINMPVAVNLTNLDNTINFINEKRRNKFTTIVCQTFNIKNSFEIYFENDTIFISVLPGKWDVTNNEPTDLIKIDDKSISFFIYNKSRKVKMEETSIKEAFSFHELENIADFVYSNNKILIALKELYNPLFIRGWEDKNGYFCFSNCRKSNNKFEIKIPSEQIIKVSCEKDVDEIIDNSTQILFDACATSRENDFILYKLAEKLKSKGVTSILCNSILSHQAIILREVGLNTIQMMKENDYLLKTKKVKEWNKISLIAN